MTADMMGDAMDDMGAEDGEEAEADELVNGVLDEIGVSLGQDLVAAPASSAAAADSDCQYSTGPGPLSLIAPGQPQAASLSLSEI